MRKSRFTKEQIVAMLKESDSGVTNKESMGFLLQHCSRGSQNMAA